MDQVQKQLLEQIADIKDVPDGAYNIRANGEKAGRVSTENIEIVTKSDKPGIDVIVKANTKNEKVYIPVVITKSDYSEVVYNDFFIGEGADVTIIAGCGIHNDGNDKSQHDGIHSFFIEKGARIKYVEKHYGDGDGNGEKIMNPKTIVEIKEDGYMEMETVQIKGVDSTDRITIVDLEEGAKIAVNEKIMTHGKQYARTSFEVELNGDNSSAHVVSRAVAKDSSKQVFVSKVNGNAKCYAHTECDGILMDNSVISAIPEVTANHIDAELIHEAAIGKIAGEQLLKLMTLGLTEEEAEMTIVEGFLK